MGYQEFDELGEKIQDIIDQAINENNYQKLSQTINQTVNRAIDSGSDALKNVLNSTFGSASGDNAAGNNDTDRNGMGNAAGNTSRTDGATGSKNAGGPGGRQYQYHSEYTNYRTGSSSQDYRQNRTWEFQENRNNHSNRNDTKNQSGNNAQANKNHVKEQTGLSADIQRSLYAPSTRNQGKRNPYDYIRRNLYRNFWYSGSDFGTDRRNCRKCGNGGGSSYSGSLHCCQRSFTWKWMYQSCRPQAPEEIHSGAGNPYLL